MLTFLPLSRSWTSQLSLSIYLSRWTPLSIFLYLSLYKFHSRSLFPLRLRLCLPVSLNLPSLSQHLSPSSVSLITSPKWSKAQENKSLSLFLLIDAKQKHSQLKVFAKIREFFVDLASLMIVFLSLSKSFIEILLLKILFYLHPHFKIKLAV